MINTQNKSGLLNYLFILTAFFILFEVSFLKSNSTFYFSDIKLIANNIKIPTSVFPAIFYFIFSQLLVHIVYTLLIFCLTYLSAISLKLSSHAMQNLGLSLWIIGIVSIIIANRVYFPNSQFSELFAFILSKKISQFSLYLIYLFWLIIFTFASIGFCQNILSINKDFYFQTNAMTFSTLKKRKRFLKSIFIAALIIVCIIAIYFIHKKTKATLDASTSNKPNIILIGVDAIRPDFLGYFGFSNITPHLDKFLDQSLVFGEAITPIARTFPAWMTVLSGKYPKHNGIRFDLADTSRINFSNSLATILKNHGYQTVFATDETRFSNITTRMGFNKIISPPEGFNDFLLGSINDFPISNLIINSAIGKLLFPYNYANRASFITYNPNTFIKYLNNFLIKDRKKPLFLATHFCLAHFPYFWSGYSPEKNIPSAHNYEIAVHKLDQQLYKFLQILNQRNVLKHSIVIIFSDHGEALELRGDRITGKKLFIVNDNTNIKTIVPKFYPVSFQKEKINQSAGHGTDVLSLTQSHSLLAIKTNGSLKINPRLISGLVSIMDIKPTLLDFLHIKYKNLDGNSLYVLTKNKKTYFSKYKNFFVESDFSPQAIRTTHPETRKLLFSGIHFFIIDRKNFRITVKPEMAKLILDSKQFANIHGHWMLALYPFPNKKYIPILVNLLTGEWTNNLNNFYAIHSPAKMMLKELYSFYGNEITNKI